MDGFPTDLFHLLLDSRSYYSCRACQENPPLLSDEQQTPEGMDEPAASSNNVPDSGTDQPEDLTTTTPPPSVHPSEPSDIPPESAAELQQRKLELISALVQIIQHVLTNFN
jgi:hypothetical protein